MGPPGRPYVYREYPKMVFKAGRVNGKHAIDGQLVADDEQMERNLLSRGYHPTQEKALDALAQDELTIAKLAAERAHHERRMSPAAQAEAAAVDDAEASHVPEIPRTPIRRGRPRKVVTA